MARPTPRSRSSAWCCRWPRSGVADDGGRARDGCQGAGRVDAVDLARGVALLGMMLVHLGPVWEYPADPPLDDMLAGGRAAPLFAMLAGVALTLVHRRDPRGAGSVRATCVRAVLLVALGLWLGSLDDMPILIILAFYGLMIVVALPFRGLSTRALVAVAAAWAVLAPLVVVALQVLNDPVSSGQAELSELRHPVDLLTELVVWGAYPAGAWFAYVLVGLAVGRLDLRVAAVAWRLVAAGAALVAATLAAGWVLITSGAVDDRYDQGWRLLFAGRNYPYEDAQWRDLLLVGEHTSTPLNVLGATGSALLVIGLCALAVRVPWVRWTLTPVRAAGTMTLTLYTVHALWFWRLSSTFDPTGPDQYAAGSYRDWLLQVVVLFGGALVWQRFVGKGPLEQVVRRASVWRRGTRHERVST